VRPAANATLVTTNDLAEEAGGEAAALLVFAQRENARVEIDAWCAHATRFFATRIGLTEEKRYPSGAAPRADRVSFVVAPNVGAAGVRQALARPCEASDLARAEAAESRAAGTGLALLARRCETVWLVIRNGDDDALALTLAAILASILLGPILDTGHSELFGVKTARRKLEALLLSR
jgi:hypothetical protein